MNSATAAPVEAAAPKATGSSRSCGCTSSTQPYGSGATCDDRELPVYPFDDLRVAYGMLLGEEDFKYLMGNPRGKQWLHTSWLHGTGVVWGLNVSWVGEEIQVGPGLAVDGVGRELRITDSGNCLYLPAWIEDWQSKHPGSPEGDHDGCPVYALQAWVVAEFACCLGSPVPMLADPCDVSRTHDGPSRIHETARVQTVAKLPKQRRVYHRLRVLFGLEEGDPEHDKETLDELEKVINAPGDQRAVNLLAAFRRLAAKDAIELEPDDLLLANTPVTTADAAVVLARLTVRVQRKEGCDVVLDVDIDNSVRRTVLPTTTIQELLCGLAPGLMGVDGGADAGGPRLIRSSVDWVSGTLLTFKVTQPLAGGSGEDAIEISSLATDGSGWTSAEIDRIQVREGEKVVRVYLDRPPADDVVRIVVRGTGPRVLFGQRNAEGLMVPFAGMEGGPPGNVDEGHDASFTSYMQSGGNLSSKEV
jgi:hypothetical protein